MGSLDARHVTNRRTSGCPTHGTTACVTHSTPTQWIVAHHLAGCAARFCDLGPPPLLCSETCRGDVGLSLHTCLNHLHTHTNSLACMRVKACRSEPAGQSLPVLEGSLNVQQPRRAFSPEELVRSAFKGYALRLYERVVVVHAESGIETRGGGLRLLRCCG